MSMTYVIRAHGINLLNLVGEGCRLVREELDELVRRGPAREQPELAVDRLCPRGDDARCDLMVFV